MAKELSGFHENSNNQDNWKSDESMLPHLILLRHTNQFFVIHLCTFHTNQHNPGNYFNWLWTTIHIWFYILVTLLKLCNIIDFCVWILLNTFVERLLINFKSYYFKAWFTVLQNKYNCIFIIFPKSLNKNAKCELKNFTSASTSQTDFKSICFT